MSAYFQGKGSGSDSVVDEANAAQSFLAHEDNLVLFDVGANKGNWTAEMLRAVSFRIGKVYQFEPSSDNIKFLEQRFSGNAKVSLAPFAVGSEKKAAELFSDVPGSGMASLYKRRLDHFKTSLDSTSKISVITLDDFIHENKISRVDFMKMDIEGGEFAALKGAKHSLADNIIRALSFEFGGANIDSRTYFQDFWYFLGSLKFSVFRVLPGGRVYSVKRYTELLECFRTTNYIAIRADR
jgi:FkbM family methyltransferase